MTSVAGARTDAQQIVEDAWRSALACHRSGRLGQAEELYAAILDAQPLHADAHHNLGVLLVGDTRIDRGLPHLLAAVEAEPKVAQYWLSYVAALNQANRRDEARQVLTLARECGLDGAAVDSLSATLSQAEPSASELRKKPPRHEVDAALALFNGGRYAEGELLARALTATYPGYGLGFGILGGLCNVQGRHAEALQALQRAAQLMPRDAEAQCNVGIVLVALQRAQDAEKYFRSAIRIDPKFGNAHFNLGTTLLARGEAAKAEQCFRRAVQLNGAVAANHEHLARAQSAQEKWMDAAQSLQRALAIDDSRAELHNDLGYALLKVNDLARAEINFRRAMSLDPTYAEPMGNLGIVLKRLGRGAESEPSLRAAAEIAPELAETHYNLGICLADQGRFAEAAECYRRTIALQPTSVTAHNNLGNALLGEHRFSEALECYEHTLALDPDFAIAHSNLGNALRALGRREEAVERHRRSLRLRPVPEAHLNLGVTLFELNRVGEAEASYRAALELKPDYVEALKGLGNVFKEQGRLTDAERCYRQALSLRPDYLSAQDNLVFELNYSANRPIAECIAEAKHYGAMARAAAKKPLHAWTHDREPKKLRVGLVSGDLHSHPVGFFLESLVARIDPGRVELIAYHNHYECDALTQRIGPHFTQWRPIGALMDAQAAQLVRDDGVNVLIDLSGHTARNRLPMFAYKPAPVQASWLGYFATTGLDAMDYIVGDPYVTPPNEAHHFTERVWALPESYLCFTPPDVPIEPSALPMLNQAPTFGCFNNLVKMTDEVVAVWARVLLAVPGSRLLLKTWQLEDASGREATWRRFAAHGIEQSRLLFEGKSPRAELLAAYQRVDIALDPFPYPGGTTSVESYWMGVPVLTRRGDRFVSHVGETIANNVGMPEWIASDNEDYIAKAVQWCADIPKLAALRGALRAKLLASPVCDAQRFARHFEDAVWGMWRETGAKR